MERVNRQELEHALTETLVMLAAKENQLKVKSALGHNEIVQSGEYGQDTLPAAPPVVEVSNNEAEFAETEIQVDTSRVNMTSLCNDG